MKDALKVQKEDYIPSDSPHVFKDVCNRFSYKVQDWGIFYPWTLFKVLY